MELNIPTKLQAFLIRRFRRCIYINEKTEDEGIRKFTFRRRSDRSGKIN
jgi:hypothetical protein